MKPSLRRLLKYLTIALSTHAPVSLAEDISLQGVWGQRLVVEDLFDQQTKAVALVVVSPACQRAIARDIAGLRRLNDDFRARGVRFVALYPEGTLVDAYKMADHGLDANLPFWLLRDENAALSEALSLQTAGEALLIDPNVNVLYRGGASGLSAAVSSFVDTGNVARPNAPVDGCALRTPRQAGGTGLTYAADVAPIVQKRCELCHRPGQAVPFTLGSYQEVYDKRARVRDMVEARRMPPWPGRVNTAHVGELQGAGWLTDAERQTILDWIDAGAPAGRLADMPPAQTWPSDQEWRIGQPDKIFAMPTTFNVPASGIVPYQFYRVPVNAPQDRWIQAVEVIPGDAKVVHHVQAHIIQSGGGNLAGAQAMLQLYGRGDNANLFAGYVPGDNFNAKTFAPGEGIRIPAHSDIIFETHYTPIGAATTDRSKIGVVFADSVPEREIKTKAFSKARARFIIPPDEPHVEMHDEYYFPKDVKIIALKPHMHTRGKTFRLDVAYADGRVENVLKIPAWDFNWQRTYELKKPLSLPTTATLRATAVFDNSIYNPNNPDPSATVTYGLQSEDEMFNCRFIYYED